MSNWFKTTIREIRPNALWDLLKWLILIGVAAVTVPLLHLAQRWRGLPLDVVIDVVVFAISFLLVSIPGYLLWRRKKRLETSPPPVSAASDIPATTVPQNSECRDKWLHEIAERDKRGISRYVYIIFHKIDYEGLQELSPYIEIIFYVINASVYKITIEKEIRNGAVYLNGVQLNPKQTNIDGSLEHISRDDRGEKRWLVVKQWLTDKEAERISNPLPDDKLFFDRLRLNVKGAVDDQAIAPERLTLPSSIPLKMPQGVTYRFKFGRGDLEAFIARIGAHAEIKKTRWRSIGDSLWNLEITLACQIEMSVFRELSTEFNFELLCAGHLTSLSEDNFI